MNLVSAAKIISTCSDLAAIGDTIQDISLTIAGEDGASQIVDAINRLDDDIKQGFQNVVNAIGDQTLITVWKQYGDSLSYIYDSAKEYLDELRTLHEEDKEYVVIRHTKTTPFKEWCQGEEGAEGVLETLATFVELAPIGPQSYPSLSGMFIEQGIGNSALDVWSEVALAAQTSDLPPLYKYKYQTVYDLVFLFMRELFTILGMIYYVHDASLKLLNKLAPDNPYKSIQTIINEHFGNASTAPAPGDKATVWQAFAAKLTELSTQPSVIQGPNVNPIDPKGQILKASLSCDQHPGPTQVYMDDEGTFRFSNMPIQVPEDNMFFTSLQFKQIPCPPDYEGDPHGGCDGTAVILTGVPATIGPYLTITGDGTSIPDLNDPTVNIGQWTPTDWNPHFYYITPSLGRADYYHTLYATPPTPPNPSNNRFTVVTGFGMVPLGNRLGLQLDYGVLDISDITNPTVESFIATCDPQWSEDKKSYFDDPGHIDLRPAGHFTPDASGVPANQLSIMTNASLMITYGNRIGLNVQLAPPLFKADFLQPTNLPILNPTNCKQPPPTY
jgi:hypothetical protein